MRHSEGLLTFLIQEAYLSCLFFQEQIQTIKESLLRTAVDEWRSLRTSLHSREGENDHLREENRILKEENRVLRERLHNLEMRLQTLEKG